MSTKIPKTSRWGLPQRRVVLGVLVAFGCVLLSVTTALAQTTGGIGSTNLQTVGTAAGVGGGPDLFTLIGRVINIVLGTTGIVLLGILLYSGYEWMSAGGEDEKVKSAKTRIRNAIIGLLILISAFALTSYIMSLLAGINSDGGVFDPSAGGRRSFGSFPSSAGSLGAGIIESHVPVRNATNVPRNTGIAITFKEPIRPSSFIREYSEATSSTSRALNTDAIRIYPTRQPDQYLTATQAGVHVTSDHLIYVIRLEGGRLLGNPTSTTDYTVELRSGPQGLLREDGQAAFGGAFGDGYRWQFNVSTRVDRDPPKILSVVPSSGGLYDRNILIQINFNKAIDPTSASGFYSASRPTFTNIQTSSVLTSASSSSPLVPLSGEYRLSNQFTTVEFVSDAFCGLNSCGRRMYCLPSNAVITTVVRAAHLSATPPLALAVPTGSAQSLYDGVVDMAGNSLDGNGDGVAQGPDRDNYSWTFGTSDAVNVTPPRIQSTVPTAGDAAAASFIPLSQSPQAVFGGPSQAGILQASTVNSHNILLRNNEPSGLTDTFWWTSGLRLLDVSGVEVATSQVPFFSRVSIDHRLYLPATTTGSYVPEYYPFFTSDVQNVYQNCFYEASSISCRGVANCCDNHPQAPGCAYPPPSSP